MLVWPISSPKMTRMFGLRPEGVAGSADFSFLVFYPVAYVGVGLLIRGSMPKGAIV